MSTCVKCNLHYAVVGLLCMPCEEKVNGSYSKAMKTPPSEPASLNPTKSCSLDTPEHEHTWHLVQSLTRVRAGEFYCFTFICDVCGAIKKLREVEL